MKLLALGLLAPLLRPAAANVEKAIFLGPPPISIADQEPTLSALNLHTLTPAGTSSIRTELERAFPRESPAPTIPGKPTWLLLRNLTQGQRYEVRVCWSAIEPTSFDLDVFELNTVWTTPELAQSLSEYASSRQQPVTGDEEPMTSGEGYSSTLLLRVLAAADYFTDRADLMRDPPPVLVDLILDPFLGNVLPRSLVPTAGYILLVAAVTWFLARRIASALRSFARKQDMDRKNQ